MSLHAAVDLGATSGRVMLADVRPGSLQLTEVHRFGNLPLPLPDGLHWNTTGLYAEVLAGMERLPQGVRTLGIDSWAIDYGLVNASGALLGTPFCYRDARTAGVAERLHRRVRPDELYGLHGLQELPFTTLYQLLAERGSPALAAAEHLLLVPDLLGFWLTGERVAERTNASTTGLLDVGTRTWSPRLLEIAGVSPALLPVLADPSTVLGPVRPAVREQTRFAGDVVVVGSHDTASAVAAVPMDPTSAAYVSLGTWGLVGVELDRPVLTDDARKANFTNELGVDGRTRFLRNVAGLFLLSECLHHWRFTTLDRDAVLDAAMALPAGPVFDVDDPRLAAPGGMPARIQDVIVDGGWPPPRRKAALVRAVLDSLALKLARTVHEAAELSGTPVQVIHVVGGGSLNSHLCQLVATAAGLPVVAGPVEATALGNALVQARAHGTLAGDLDTLRALVRATSDLRRFEP